MTTNDRGLKKTHGLSMRIVTVALLSVWMGLAIGNAPGEHAAIDCPPLHAQSRQLLEGDAAGFYFIDSLGGAFPVPTFFLVKASDRAPGRINLEIWDNTPAPGQSPLHEKANVCHWTMTVTLGPRDDLENYVGSMERLDARTVEKFEMGDILVRTLESPLSGETNSVVAWNEHGYMMFIGTPTDRALWMLSLFDQMRERRP